MNLNEECLLQFLKNDLPFQHSAASVDEKESTRIEGFLRRNIRRIFKHKNYVSFPAAVWIHRSPNQPK